MNGPQMGLGDMIRLLGQMNQMRDKFAGLQKRAAQRTVEGAAGGGLAKATVSGLGEVLSVSVEPEALKDPETLGPLIAAAVNQALAKNKEAAVGDLREAMGGLDLPPGLKNLPGMPF